MSSIAPAIKEKYDEHSALLERISKTEYAAPAYQSNEDRIKKLQEKLEKRKKKLEKLKLKTKSEYEDFQEIKRSVTKRFVLRIKSGKEGLDKQAAKEEEDYLEAFSEEQNAKAEISVMERELVLAIKAREELQADADQHAEAQKKLDEIYTALFSGTTRDFPEEDKAEEEVKAATEKYNEVQGRLNNELEAHVALKKSEKAMKKACKNMEKAEEFSLRDLLSTNLLYNTFERQELHSAKAHAVEAMLFAKEARDINPKVRELPDVKVPIIDKPAGASLTFDGDSENVQLHRLISHGVKEAEKYLHKLETEKDRSEERLEALTKETAELQTKLQKCRTELESIRKTIFLKVKQGIIPGDVEGSGPWLPSPHPDKRGSLPEYYSKDPSFPFPNEPKQRLSLPLSAGGFKDSLSGDVALGVPEEEAQLRTPTFPDGPGFGAFPANPPQHIPPGFRVAAMEAGASRAAENVDAITFPKPELGKVNPYAAFLMMHENDSYSEDEGKDIGSEMPLPHPASSTKPDERSPPLMPGAMPIMPEAPRAGSPEMPVPSPRTATLVSKMKDVSLKDDQQMLPKASKGSKDNKDAQAKDIKMPVTPGSTKKA